MPFCNFYRAVFKMSDGAASVIERGFSKGFPAINTYNFETTLNPFSSSPEVISAIADVFNSNGKLYISFSCSLH